jgi:hypothetical protein
MTPLTQLEFDEDELEILTNALSVYTDHEEALHQEIIDKGLRGSNIDQLFIYARDASAKLRARIVEELGYDPTDG